MLESLLAPSEVPVVAARLRLAVGRLARQIRHHAVSGLRLPLQSALATIDRSGPLTLSQLAAREQVAPPTITKIVGQLEEEGLIARVPDDTDGRVTWVSITPAGGAALQRARGRAESFLGQQLAQLGPEDLDRLAASIEVLEWLSEPPEVGT